MREKKAAILSDVKDKENIKNSKIISLNTVEIKMRDGTKIIRLHHADIITVLPNGDTIFDSGGYHTQITKERINFYSDFTISQNNSIWYIYKNNKNAKHHVFYDGITFTKRGRIKTPERKINLKKRKLLNEKIKRYVNLLDKMVKLPRPHDGDCFYCSLYTQKGKPLGDELTDNDHILSHVNSQYIFGSILVNAMRDAGYSDEQIGMQYELNSKDLFKKSLKKYLTEKLL